MVPRPMIRAGPSMRLLGKAGLDCLRKIRHYSCAVCNECIHRILQQSMYYKAHFLSGFLNRVSLDLRFIWVLLDSAAAWVLWEADSEVSSTGVRSGVPLGSTPEGGSGGKQDWVEEEPPAMQSHPQPQPPTGHSAASLALYLSAPGCASCKKGLASGERVFFSQGNLEEAEN